jgi:hypothetical protein
VTVSIGLVFCHGTPQKRSMTSIISDHFDYHKHPHLFLYIGISGIISA